MELRHLQSFLAVYERGSFRAAAERLHVAQPAVSRHVQQLERDLGTALFVRSASGAAPTASADAFYARIEPAVRELLAAVEATRTTRTVEALRIGYIAPALRGPVAQLVTMVRARDPDAEIQLVEATSGDVAAGLRSRSLDVGFLIGDDESAPDLAQVGLAALRYRLVVSPRHPLAGQRVVDLAELADHTFITIAEHEPTHRRILEVVLAHAPGVRVQSAFGYQEVYGLVASGVGVAAVPPLGVAGEPTDVRILQPRPALPAATLAVATRRRWRSAWSDVVAGFTRDWQGRGTGGGTGGGTGRAVDGAPALPSARSSRTVDRVSGERGSAGAAVSGDGGARR